MLDAESMKITALVTDLQHPDQVYMAEDDVVPADPPIALTVSKRRRHPQGIGLAFLRLCWQLECVDSGSGRRRPERSVIIYQKTRLFQIWSISEFRVGSFNWNSLRRLPH